MNITSTLLAAVVAVAPGPAPSASALQVNGSKLVYEVAGKGPAIVLIHAGVADMSVWDEPFHALARHFRVLRYDTRGFGKSITKAVTFSNRADLLALMDHVKMDRAVLVGNSRGGQIAVDFALEHPARVAGVVSVAGGLSGFEKTPADVPKEPTAGEKAVFSKVEALYEKKDLEGAAELESAIWASGPEQHPNRAPAVRERIRKMILHNNRTHTTEPQPIPLEPPAAMRLGELKAPVLVMIGEYDESATRTMAAFLAAHAPNARKLVFPRTAHMISLEHPADFVREVTSFTRACNR